MERRQIQIRCGGLEERSKGEREGQSPISSLSKDVMGRGGGG